MTWGDAIQPIPSRRLGAAPRPAWLASPARFYAKLQQILEGWRFDRLVEGLCSRFYAGHGARGAAAAAAAVLPPHVYFRLLMIGLFEGIDSEGGITWRIEDSDVLRCFLGGGRPARVPAAEQVARTRGLINAAMHEEVFHWLVTALNDCVMPDVADPRVALAADDYLPWVRGQRYAQFLRTFLAGAAATGPVAPRSYDGHGRHAQAVADAGSGPNADRTVQ